MKFFLLISLFLTGACLRTTEVPCAQIVLHSKDNLDFTDTEKRMVCGDPKLEGYQNIPPYQAEVFFKGFLQSRGYLKPKFEVINEVLHVHPGEVSRIKEIHVTTGEEKERKNINDEVHRLYRKRTITPKHLDALEADGLSVVRRRGYPCAKIETLANTDDNSVALNYKLLNYFPFGEIQKDKIEGLHENALLRFYPFRADEAFNEQLLGLTEKRMLRAEVVSGTYFMEKCSPESKDFSMTQHFIIGPPRTFRYGVGANTEVGPMARVRWSNNRFKPMASQLSATLQASLRVQSINLSSDHYFWNDHPRRSLFSQFEIIRESQYDYLQTVLRFKPHMKWTDDKLRRLWTYTLGPTLESGSFKTQENDANSFYNTVAMEGSFSWMSHLYEYFDLHPEDGDTFVFNFDFRHPSLGFDQPMLKFDSSFAKLSKVGVWDRGNVIAGMRINAGTNFVPADTDIRDLPPSVKFYGGGSDDVRGFLLRTLPKNDGVGALTKLGLKLELRRTHFFHEKVEGFAFVDSAYFGEKSWSLDPRLWYSPGIGIRWISPIGLIQSYASRALATSPNEDFGNFYFIGLGGTF